MSSSKLKRCKQCGDIKPVDMFRKYYGQMYSENARYKLCLVCEKINNRYKYLSKKPSPTHDDTEELKDIEALYEMQRSRGLKPPGYKSADRASMKQLLEAELAKQQALLNPVLYTDAPPEATHLTTEHRVIPEELLFWLYEDLTKHKPEYLQGEVSDTLIEKYRPQTGVDAVTYKPVYDDQYREVLQDVFKRFDDYEETAYED